MKKITVFLFVMLFSGFVVQSYGISVPVTFQVDMSNQFVSPDGVHIAGAFDIAWDPAAYALSDEGGGIYAITLNLSIGSNVEYKFINGNDWPYAESVPGECAQNTNRYINVASAVTLEPVCFGSCVACEPASMVTFSVNMQDKEVTDGVFIAGSFQGWNAATTPMTLVEDAYYSVTVIIPVGHNIEYKFVNNGWDWENVPGCCNQNGNRAFTVTDEDATIDAVCFGNCYDCTEETVAVTFQVDMSSEVVSADGVHIAGSFQGWDPAGTLMTDAGNGVFYHTANVVVGSCIEYKFVNGNSWDFAENVPGECAMGWNRFVEPFTNQILNPVCYGSCVACEGGTSDLIISEYAEGSSNNKYIEIFNGTGESVDLAGYVFRRANNGSPTWQDSLLLEGTLADGDVYVISNPSSAQYILDRTDITSTITFYNGDDAVYLYKNNVAIDVIGILGEDPGSNWPVAGISPGTAEKTLVRKANICSPITDWASSAGTNTDDSQWIVNPQNYWDDLGFHVANCGGVESVAMPAFSMPGGLVVDPFDLEITCATPDAVIYFTTDGSDPDFNSDEFTVPFNIAGSTTVKAIAYAPGFSASSISVVNYQFPIELDNLSDLRAAFNSKADYYKVTGEVFLTFQQDWRGQKFIEDDYAAVLIDDNSGVITTVYNVGDGITGIIGSLAEYGNMLQFTPAFDPGPATSSGTFITPQNISLNELFSNFEEYEAELVKVEEIVFADAGDNFVNGWTFEMSDDAKATGDFRCTFYGMDYIGTPIPGERLAVVGLPNSNFDGDYLTSRDLNDFVNYTYPSGWTGISSNVTPEGSAAMEDVLAGLVDDMVILVGIDGIFWPGQNLNTIGDWDTYKGYKIKFANESAFEFEGMGLEDLTVTVEPGISYVPVLSQEAVAVEDVIVPLGTAIEFMFDIRFGLIYWPTGGILPGSSPVSLDMLYPGFAYLTRANSTAIIDYDVALPKIPASLPGLNVENKTPWNNVIRTGDQHIISIMATEMLEAGDVIGTFNTNGSCTAMSVFAGEEVLPLIVYADDNTTGELDGMTSGEVMTMKVFRNGEIIDVTPVYNTNFENHDGLFTLNGLSVISELKLGATGIGEQNAAYSIYPNPGNGMFNITIDGEYTISVSNAHGQLVMTTIINGNNVLDLRNQPNGIYFIHLTNQTSTIIEKVIIK
jgi:hypothetical protein